MHRTLGIDLGTTNSVVAWMKNGAPEVLPVANDRLSMASAVGVTEDGGLLVGEEALRWLDRDPERVVTSVKRFMGRKFDEPAVQETLSRMGDAASHFSEGGDGGILVRLGPHQYTPVQISAIVLRRLKTDVEARLGVVFDRAVITAPAYFGERQLAATRAAGELAGLHVVRVLVEPTSAALAHGLTRPQDAAPATFVVYDLGGGTFDVSVLNTAPGYLDVMSLGGDNLLGGTDFDDLLATSLKERWQSEKNPHENAKHPPAGEKNPYEDAKNPPEGAKNPHAYVPAPSDDFRLRRAAEQAKIRLSLTTGTDVTVSPLGTHGATLEQHVTRASFEALITPHITKTVGHTTEALSRIDHLPEDVSQVLLVGGSSAIPLVRENLAELFGEDRLRTDIDPMHCVALGAAVQSALLDELTCPSCHTTNPIAADACTACEAALTGAPTIDCPACHVPAPSGSAACPVCAQDLSALTPPPLKATVVECSQCGEENPAAAMLCTLCEEPLPGFAGLKCPRCGMVNSAGLSACSHCDKEFAVSTPLEVTALPFGIQQKDGTLRVLVEAGESYPTDWHVKEFQLTGRRGDMLEILLREGDLQPAHLNDLCASHTYEIEEDFTGTRSLVIRARLNSDRIIDLEFRIDNADWHAVELNRNPLTSKFRGRVLNVHRDYVTYLANWQHELEQAEIAQLEDTERRLRALLAGGSTSGTLDHLLDDARRRREQQDSVRWAAALSALYPRYVPHLVSPDDLESMRRNNTDIRAARREGDLPTAYAIAEEVIARKERLGYDLYRVMSTLASASQGRVSSALARRILDVGTQLQEAAAVGDTAARDAAISRMVDLHKETSRELQQQDVPERQTIRPEGVGG
ncbi:Hsp70 family protein [Streptomyces sp. NBC_00237]|uniref:Hsp70 family protein n=1 Tax=Streptomyces sp. NBC_00237 TaxID=2975687 RepID=UPI00224DBF8D|nr:Hsp70 family protein [Streptomyces sp. NBC_00237]MCX5206599.1 Hsp70 family protein [Streptomyces sp. NBC_00237]